MTNNGEELYRRYLDGDRDAIGEIMLIYRDGLTVFINGYLHDEAESEDIAMDVFLYLLTHPGRYDFRGSLKAYLYTIGRSRAIDRLRRRAKIRTVELFEATEVAADTPTPAEEYADRERRRALASALKVLPAAQGEAVRLVYFEKLTYAETAKIMRKSPKQVDNLLTKAKRSLHGTLTKGGWGNK